MRARSIHPTVSVAAALLLASAAEVDLQQAKACSTEVPAPDFGWGEPSDSATDIPTNVILYYPIPAGALSGVEGEGVPGTFTLKAMGAVPVAVTARRVHYWNFELVPAEELAPNTAYELTAHWPVGDGDTFDTTIRFTTGAGPLEGAPAMPRARIEHYQFMTNTWTSCDPLPTGSCLSFGDPDAFVEIAHVDNFGQVHEPYLTRGSMMTDLAGIEQGTPFECVQLRTRAMNGAFSAPQTLCRDDGRLSQLTSPLLDCTPDGLTVDGMPVGSELEAEPADAGTGTVDPNDDLPPPEGEGPLRPAPDAGPSDAPPPRDDVASDEPDSMNAAPEGTPASSSSSGGCSAAGASVRGAWSFFAIALIGLYLRKRA